MGEGWGIRSIHLCIVYELALHLVLYIFREKLRFETAVGLSTAY